MRQRQHLRIVIISIISLCFILAYTWLPFLSQPPEALAHAFVIGSDPVDGSTVSSPPTVVRIYFNAPISAASSASVYVFTAGGAQNGQLVSVGRSAIPATNARELDTHLLPQSQLPQGSYEVRWTALADDDGHATSGLIGFNVGQSSLGLSGTPILGPQTSNHLPQLNLQGVLTVAWDWLVLMALTLWVGILALEAFITRRPTPPVYYEQARKQARPLQALSLFALLAGEIISLILRAALLTQTVGGNGIGLGAIRQIVLETSYGYLWITRIALVCIALLFLRYTSRTQGVSGAGRSASKGFSQLRQQVQQSAQQAMKERETPSRPVVKSGALTTTAAATTPRGSTGGAPRGGNITIAFEHEDTTVRVPPRWQTYAWLTLAGLILVSVALSSDILPLAQLPISAGVFVWLYLAAQSLWIGGAAYLGFILLPLLPNADPDHHAETTVSLLKRLRPLAFFTIGVLVISQLFLSETTIRDAKLLLDDPYGRALLVKIALCVLMALLTLYAFFLVLPKLQRQSVLLPVVDAELPARRARQAALTKTEALQNRTMHMIVWLGAGALLCGALMIFYAPPIVFPPLRYTANSSAPGATATTGSGNINSPQTKQVGGMSITLQVTPGKVEYDNAIFVTLADAQGNPITNAQVTMTTNMELMDMGEQRAIVKGSGSGTYVATIAKDFAFSMFGIWDVTVQVTRPGQAPVSVKFQVTVAG